jgi:hypothetical protein
MHLDSMLEVRLSVHLCRIADDLLFFLSTVSLLLECDLEYVYLDLQARLLLHVPLWEAVKLGILRLIMIGRATA